MFGDSLQVSCHCRKRLRLDYTTRNKCSGCFCYVITVRSKLGIGRSSGRNAPFGDLVRLEILAIDLDQGDNGLCVIRFGR